MEFLSSWRGRRVLVTGGTGFIGNRVLQQGALGGIHLHNLSHRQTPPSAIESHQIDLRDQVAVRRLIDEIKPEAVIHLATAGVTYGSASLADMLNANVIGTANLLAAVDSLGTNPPFVMGGTGYEYAPQNRPIRESDPVGPLSPYAVSKAAAALCAGYYSTRIPITLLRLFSVYGPVEKEPRLVPYIIASAQAGRSIELTGCEQIRDFTYVEDAAESFWRALSTPLQDRKLRVLNVGSGIGIALKEFVAKLVTKLRQKGLEAHVKLGAKPYRADEPMTFLADINLLQQTLGWLPMVGIDEGLHRMIDAIL
jgi:nucleoside-diphosphate-sugar epimerase